MKKIISYPLSIIHYSVYIFLLVLFHPLQWICIHWIGRNAHKKLVDFLNILLIKSLWITFNRVKFTFTAPIPENVPLLFLANHQSVYDIPPLIWFLRKFSLRFVGKKELGNGTPSITINLRNNGSVLIDRKNPQEAIAQLEVFGKSLQKEKDAGMIFPEGTRARNGKPKPFKTSGLKAIASQIPYGYFVPITINNSWKILKYGVFPLGIGNCVTFQVHTPIKINPQELEQQITQMEEIINSNVKF
ncbi:lysophospholipid acyltransferase family protein [Capnocytophaga canimorsus]|uniref:1-acyl-sn-glycerol-3-phosphate acyltransferase 1 n=1 Tax=Capnocytophaga canimorsus TaxID=28188 RepID=A0A0B7IDK3_9FLAO|nr:lysophospholipid acyltransferase family protein [Capnocytophaga canimorsus]CEN48754.1 1-acyl-sn-glycerol-3-phosphate acyltransferase 1 [Capnocytophaga canimorsus]